MVRDGGAYSLMEKQTVSSLMFPPGVRFHPSDEELIAYYLLNKVNSKPLPAAVVAEIELYNYNPWDLPNKALFGENEWYFFTPRDRKYPNGARPNRSAASGYWKATGTDKPIMSSSGATIGVKKALVFYTGKPPHGVKTNWIMIEYRIPDTLIRPQRSKGSMRLDNWVLCRIRLKGNMSKNAWETPSSPNKPVGIVNNIKSFAPVNLNYPSENCTDYFLSKDCQLLAKLLATRDFPQSAADSSVTSQNSNTVESPLGFQGGSSGQHGKPNDESGYGHLSTRATATFNNNESYLSVNMLGPSGTTSYNHYESQGQLLKLNLSNAITHFQDINASTFAGRFMQ